MIRWKKFNKLFLEKKNVCIKKKTVGELLIEKILTKYWLQKVFQWKNIDKVFSENRQPACCLSVQE